jgi:hypothetical protein
VYPPNATAPIVTLNRVVINNNTSTDSNAGGVFISGATVTIDQSTISGNSLSDGNDFGAGGIYITSAGEGGGSAVTITNSTISGNSVTGSGGFVTGGIYVYASQLTVINSTIAGNSANTTDIYATGGLSLQNAYAGIYNSTITSNSASGANASAFGGIVLGNNYVGGALSIDNSILAGNTAATPDLGVYNASNVVAQFTLMGSALQGSYSGNGNVFSDSPGLSPLANNGGPTQTMKPNPGSPALDVGNIALIPNGVTTDQRGVGFPRTTNGLLDLGSVQAGPAAVAAAPVPTPTLSSWAMLVLGGLLGLLGLRKRRRLG